jgi:hypothetical protein
MTNKKEIFEVVDFKGESKGLFEDEKNAKAFIDYVIEDSSLVIRRHLLFANGSFQTKVIQ